MYGSTANHLCHVRRLENVLHKITKQRSKRTSHRIKKAVKAFELWYANMDMYVAHRVSLPEDMRSVFPSAPLPLALASPETPSTGRPAGACHPMIPCTVPVHAHTHAQELHTHTPRAEALRRSRDLLCDAGREPRTASYSPTNPYACLSSSIDSASAKIPSFQSGSNRHKLAFVRTVARRAASGSIYHPPPPTAHIGVKSACKRKRLHPSRYPPLCWIVRACRSSVARSLYIPHQLCTMHYYYRPIYFQVQSCRMVVRA